MYNHYEFALLNIVVIIMTPLFKTYWRISLTLIAAITYSSPLLSNSSVFQAEYSLHAKGLKVAKMQRQHSVLENGNHFFKSETKTVGLASLFRDDHIIESTEWKENNSDIQPIKYSYQRSNKKKKRQVQITFDETQQRIINSINNDNWTLPFQEGVYDKLLYQIVLMKELSLGDTPKEYSIADGGKIKSYRFSQLGKETIDTPIGKLETIKMSLHKDNKERKTILWCAESLDFLPVKVENTEKNGDHVIAIIESLIR